MLALASLLAATADDPLAGRTAGPPTDCIDSGFAPSIQIVDDHTILYRETDRRVWRTGPDTRCPWLEPSATLIIEQFGAELCRGDRFRVRRQGDGIPSPTCRFTAFTPYDRPRS